MIGFRKVPVAVRELALDERRLAWGVTTAGEALVATPTGLVHGGGVLPWTQVEKATWTEPRLTVVEVAVVEGTGAGHAWELAEDNRLAETVRAAVTSSVAWTDVRRLEPAGKVRVVGRRVPGQDALLWQVVWLDGTDSADPRLRAQVEHLVAALRGSLG